MTGLELGKDKIIEIAAVITDKFLQPVDPEGFERVIHRSESEMTAMGQWCIEHHGKVIEAFSFCWFQSGLTGRVLASKNTTDSVEKELLEYIQRYVPQGEGLLAGHCVYVDREFMRHEFPRVINWLNFRIIGNFQTHLFWQRCIYNQVSFSKLGCKFSECCATKEERASCNGRYQGDDCGTTVLQRIALENHATAPWRSWPSAVKLRSSVSCQVVDSICSMHILVANGLKYVWKYDT